MKITAVVPAAGAGKRMKKRAGRKPFFILGKRPILAHTLSRLQRSPYIKEIILVLDKNDITKGRRLVKAYRLSKVTGITVGGKSRFESVQKGLGCVGKGTELVLIHDGARPFLKQSIIKDTINAARRSGAAIAAVPATSTIKFVKKNRVIYSTPDRDKLWIIATPQVFKYKLLLTAYKKGSGCKSKIFDDAGLVERLGRKIKVVQDSSSNIKITTPLDLAIGEAILKYGGSK